ncbi:MAG: ABC transporter permease subunit [Chloroflexi bacterium]|nr:ABC transporter permease subunit [Chloroflexota bacterium]
MRGAIMGRHSGAECSIPAPAAPRRVTPIGRRRGAIPSVLLRSRAPLPDGEHVDDGRDVLARVVHGARVSLLVGFGAVAVYVTIGIVLGLIAGFAGGVADQVIMRITDTVMSIPTLLLVIVFVSVAGPVLNVRHRRDRAAGLADHRPPGAWAAPLPA